MAFTISPPFEHFTNVDGKPLENGYIYIGEENLDPQTNPVQIYLNEALTIPFAQPIRTKGGFPVNAGTPVTLYAAAKYSIRVLNKHGSQVYQDLSFTGSGGRSSADVLFVQAGTGAATQSVQSKLRQYVAANDYNGVDPTGVNDSTLGLKAAFDYAIPLGIPVEMDGRYRITGPIQPYAARASGELHIIVKGKTEITVDPAAIAFTDILYFETTVFNSCTILGGELVVNGNNKAARGIFIRHNDAGGGIVDIQATLKLSNFLNTVPTDTRSNCALQIFGRYDSVTINTPYIYSVNRTNATIGVGSGDTKGIAVSSLAGTCVINDPHVELVTSPTGIDADGIAVFGFDSGSAVNSRMGKATINSPRLINCAGRSIKGQISDIVINNPYVKRVGVVSGPSSVDHDIQFCGDASIVNPVFEYYETLGVSPLGSSFTPVVFQQTLPDRDSVASVVGGTLYTQVPMSRFCVGIYAAAARSGVITVDGLNVVPIGSFATSAFTRALVEVDMGTIAAKSSKTRINVHDVTAPISGWPLIGYTGYSSGSLTSKFSYECVNCESTLSTSNQPVVASISGTVIGEVERFLVANNRGFASLFQNGSGIFSFANLVPGGNFSVDLATGVTASIVLPPPWGTVGIASVECIGQWSNTPSSLMIRVVVGHGEKPSMRFFTRDGGTTWHSECLPFETAASIASIAATINTRNKLAGLFVWDSTNRRIMVAEGSAAGSLWWVADGSASVTPV